MMQPKDIAQAILLCASMPQRTVVEEIVLKPTRKRDVSADLYAAATKEK
jgi:NADP-dependent 3-hydroxy acid dehydrogenase YdfG